MDRLVLGTRHRDVLPPRYGNAAQSKLTARVQAGQRNEERQAHDPELEREQIQERALDVAATRRW